MPLSPLCAMMLSLIHICRLRTDLRSCFFCSAVVDGMLDQMCIRDRFVLEPGAEGWGSAAEEKAYMDAAIAFLKSGNNEAGINVFSTFGEFYLAGYGEGAAPLEAWAAENPIFVISQAFVDGESCLLYTSRCV